MLCKTFSDPLQAAMAVSKVQLSIIASRLLRRRKIDGGVVDTAKGAGGDGQRSRQRDVRELRLRVRMDRYRRESDSTLSLSWKQK